MLTRRPTGVPAETCGYPKRPNSTCRLEPYHDGDHDFDKEDS